MIREHRIVSDMIVKATSILGVFSGDGHATMITKEVNEQLSEYKITVRRAGLTSSGTYIGTYPYNGFLMHVFYELL